MQKLLVFSICVLLLSACAAPTPASTLNTQTAPVIPTVMVTLPPAVSSSPTATTAPLATAAPTVPVSTQPVVVETPTTAANTQAVVPVTGAQTYTVLVGGDDMGQAADYMAYFPGTVKVHVGDTVHWKLNTKEIHTVSFLAGQVMPDFQIPLPNAPQGVMMFNPLVAFPAGPKDGQYDGSGYANSGIMGPDQGQTQDYQLTFTKAGSYPYVCAVHGKVMSGTVEVVDTGTSIPSPEQASAQGQQEMAALQAKVAAAVSAAKALEQPDQKNADGTTTHHIEIGYSDGQIDLMSFFPSQVNVKQGDTVVWHLGPKDIAPHTVTFLNGTPDIPMVNVQPVPGGQPILTFNPTLAAPQNAGKPLTNQGLYNSGLLVPNTPLNSYSLKIGNTTGELGYVCLLHDEMGMKGSLVVTQ